MLALLEIHGISNFDCLNDNTPAQIQYVYDIISSDPDYEDMPGLISGLQNASKVTKADKAETSVLIRNRGNQAYAKKDFEAALLYFSQSALMGPIDLETGQGREVAIALANRSAVHFEMSQW